MLPSVILFLCITYFNLGFNPVLGFKCDTEVAEVCHIDLVNYEVIFFPFYGGTEEKLDETCKGMNSTFECVADFISECKGDPDCDEHCQDMVKTLSLIYENTGVRDLYNKLCDHEEVYRKEYLHNYQCMEEVEDKYSVCKNITQESRDFLADHDFGEKLRDAHCCFFSWYQMCFTNATMETCGTNTTFVVSFALHLLMGNIAKQMCSTLPPCHEPPLPDNYIGVSTSTENLPDNKPQTSESSVLGTNFCFFLITFLLTTVNSR